MISEPDLTLYISNILKRPSMYARNTNGLEEQVLGLLYILNGEIRCRHWVKFCRVKYPELNDTNIVPDWVARRLSIEEMALLLKDFIASLNISL